jgi:sulfur-oxidizing protein SoxZ
MALSRMLGDASSIAVTPAPSPRASWPNAARGQFSERLLAMARALINVPTKAKRGEVISIKTLISHTMESGFRHTTEGARIERDIITAFDCTYNGVEIFHADLYPAIAANPFITFHTVATESGTLVFTWTGDNGFTATESVNIQVA